METKVVYQELWVSLSLSLCVSLSVTISMVWSKGRGKIRRGIISIRSKRRVRVVRVSLGFRLSHGQAGESENYNELHADWRVVRLAGLSSDCARLTLPTQLIYSGRAGDGGAEKPVLSLRVMMNFRK